MLVQLENKCFAEKICGRFEKARSLVFKASFATLADETMTVGTWPNCR